MAKQKQILGRWGEKKAERFLVEKGFEIIDRNARTEYGEIDLVARKGDETVFVEVKTRSSTAFGFPEESVSKIKQQHLADAAETYLQSHPELDAEWRIDVISIRRIEGKPPEIVHFEYAVEG
jgi:putative endonuclease